MTVPPIVSVILPTFNRPRLLAEAVESVRSQTFRDWELIVVDDGSDPPAAVADDAQIHLLRLPENRGPAASRNEGLRAAAGQAVAFLDDDDLYLPIRLELGLLGLEAAPVSVCVSRFVDSPDEGEIRRLEGDVSDSILDGPTPCLGATMVLRSACPDFSERWHAVEDVEWWLRVAERNEVHTTDRVGHLVRRHEGLRYRNHQAARVDENLALLDANRSWFDHHPRAEAYRLRRAGLIALSLDDRRRARRLLLRSLARRPSARALWHVVRATAPPRPPKIRTAEN